MKFIMKKIIILMAVLFAAFSVSGQNLKVRRLRADTFLISNFNYSLSDTVMLWSNDTLKMGFFKGTAGNPYTVFYTDSLLGRLPNIDSCIAYLKVKRIASCSPLWLSSPDSVWITGDLRQIDGSVAFRGTSGDNPFHNDGELFMWYGAKAALRAGTANGNEWLTDSIGQNSFAFGNQVKAIGDHSFAAGTQLRVSGDAGVGFGANNKNHGNSSIIFGINNINFSSGAYSLVGGSNNFNYGNNSAVFGTNNINSANYSLVGGNVSYLRGTGESSLVWGDNLIGNKQYQSVLGTYNDTKTAALFIVGIGTGVGAANGIEVYADSTVRTPGKFVQYYPEHAFGYYADNTGFPVQIAVQNAWMDMTDSTAVRTTGVEIVGFTNDNDTLIFAGYTKAHLFFNFTASVSGTNAQDFEMRVFNITDNAAVPGTDLFTTTGATNRTNVTILAYDKNADVGDKYIIQVRNTSAAADLQVYRYMAKINVEHYKH